MKDNWTLNFKKIGYIALIWVAIAGLQVCYDSLVVATFQDHPTHFRFWDLLWINILVASVAGVLAGVAFTKMDEIKQNMPFWKAVLQAFVFYAILSVAFISFGSLIFHSILVNSSPFSEKALEGLKQFLISKDFIRHFLTWGIVTVLTIVVLAVNDKYGQNNFRDFLLGRYFQPREEHRIFLFLDIKGSTTIAEKLGAKSYFHFLRDFIRDTTPPILEAKGAIYQYVGDEIVVTWQLKKGIQNNNCLRCFYAIERAIEAKKAQYLDKYQHIPTFKAGLHCGEVTAGEIGVVKKDVIFSGDVLNTASRIQAECNKHGVNILLSDDLLKCLALLDDTETQSIGNIELRGKRQKVGLSKILKYSQP